MAVLAHPDDESLGVGGTLAKYAAEGVDVFLLTATRGDSGKYRGHRSDDPQHPGPEVLASLREAELRAAATVLGVHDVVVLDYHDQQLDRVDAHEAVSSIAEHLRRVRPDVVVTFGPDGAYGHPDHIAISQLTTAAIVAGSISPLEFHANWRRAFTMCADGRLATAKARDHPPSWSTVTIKRPANRLDTARNLSSRSLRRLSSASVGSTTMRTSETLRRRIAAMARATESSGSSARQSGK